MSHLNHLIIPGILLALCLLAALAIHLMWRVKPELDGMSNDELLDAAYEEADWNKFPNKYSRECDRRRLFGRAI